MHHFSQFILCCVLGLLVYSCTPERGCTEQTADNYSALAEEDDGTCIPSRDKLIGFYTYSAFWTDVVSGTDTFGLGSIQITEANTAKNAFNMNFDGSLFIQGSVTQSDIQLDVHRPTPTTSYSGNGSWLENDSVDVLVNVTFTSDMLPAPQPKAYYCRKIN